MDERTGTGELNTAEPEALDEKELEAAVESILFASGEPVHIDRICLALSLERPAVEQVLRRLSDYYAYERRGIRLLRMEESWQLCSSPDHGGAVRKAFEVRKTAKLSQPALEALTIVAYYQPTTRAYVDKLRGVDSGYTMSLLVERGLIEECGRLQVPGRPRLYRTTQKFLRSFHLDSLDDLPALPEAGMEGQERLEDGGASQPAALPVPQPKVTGHVPAEQPEPEAVPEAEADAEPVPAEEPEAAVEEAPEAVPESTAEPAEYPVEEPASTEPPPEEPEEKPESTDGPEPDSGTILEEAPESTGEPEPDGETVPEEEPESTGEPEPDGEPVPEEEPEGTDEPEPNSEAVPEEEPKSTDEPEPDSETVPEEALESTGGPESDGETVPEEEPESTGGPEPDSETVPEEVPGSTDEPEPDGEAVAEEEPGSTGGPEPDSEAVPEEAPESMEEPVEEPDGADVKKNGFPPGYGGLS